VTDRKLSGGSSRRATAGLLALVLFAGCGDSTGPAHVDLTGTWRAAANTVGHGAGITMTLTEDAAGAVTGTWTRQCAEAGCPQTGPAYGTHTQEVALYFEGYEHCVPCGHGQTCCFAIGFGGTVSRRYRNRLVGSTYPPFHPVTFER
jgi:hypothetical protein